MTAGRTVRGARACLAMIIVALALSACRATWTVDNGPRGPESVEVAPAMPDLFGSSKCKGDGPCAPVKPSR